MDVDPDLYSDRFQIEEIVSDRTTRSGKTRFYLKYVGYPESENTWELEEDLLKLPGLSAELRKYTALNLKGKQRRRALKPTIYLTKPGLLTPTGTHRQSELKRRRALRAAKTKNASRSAQQMDQDIKTTRLPPATYFITRIIFLRLLGLIYFTAFLVAHFQNPALIGDNGLTPAADHWKKLNSTFQTNYPWDGLQASPNLLWFLPQANVANTLETFSIVGIVGSFWVLVSGRSNALLMSVLWSLYFSIVGLGGRWYSFGWESQLLETGFLAIFATPLYSFAYNGTALGGWSVVWGYRWLIFRILLGAGLIKLRGDKCWTDLTCMDYHYETQPVPGPTSRWYHHNPSWFHQMETGANHVVELLVPFMMLFGRASRSTSGCVQILFQFILISSGNLSFLNWLTIVPSLWCLDDCFYMDALDVVLNSIQCIPVVPTGLFQTCLRHSFGYNEGMRMKEDVYRKRRENKTKESSGDRNSSSWGMARLFYTAVGVGLGVVIGYESIPVVNNLLAIEGQQAMNTNFNSWKLVNTYGAFGSITKIRTEIILQGTNAVSLNDPSTVVWQEYEFKCKPGKLDRAPCWITPYHYRLDWLMWFAAFSTYGNHPWLLHFVAKLLVNDPLASDLIQVNPFLGGTPPTFIRAEHYVYEYTSSKPGEISSKNWWKRTRKGEYFPPIELKNPSFQTFLKQNDWVVPGGV